jgi:hypothetical protein
VDRKVGGEQRPDGASTPTIPEFRHSSTSFYDEVNSVKPEMGENVPAVGIVYTFSSEFKAKDARELNRLRTLLMLAKGSVR